VKSLERAVELNENDFAAQFNLGISYYSIAFEMYLKSNEIMDVKKYNEATGAITGEPASTTAVAVTTAPWWATMISGIVTTLGLAYITQSASAAPGETVADINNQGGGQGGEGTASKFAQSGLLPILLIGGAAAAYYFYSNKKK